MNAQTKWGGLNRASRPGALELLLSWIVISLPAYGQVTDARPAEAIASSAQAVQPSKIPELVEVARLVVQKTNAYRKEQGLTEVKANRQLSEAVQYFAQYMAKTNQYGHTADGKHPWERANSHGYDYCLVSENIAYKFNSLGFETAQLAEEFFQGWKNSPEHRKNMLDSAVSETAVAVAKSPETGYFYAVQMFGRPKSQSIDFEIVNHSTTAVEYSLEDRSFPLPPGYTRKHQQCRPLQVTFRWPEGAQGDKTSREPKDGDRFIVTDEGGKLQVKKERARPSASGR